MLGDSFLMHEVTPLIFTAELTGSILLQILVPGRTGTSKNQQMFKKYFFNILPGITSK